MVLHEPACRTSDHTGQSCPVGHHPGAAGTIHERLGIGSQIDGVGGCGHGSMAGGNMYRRNSRIDSSFNLFLPKALSASYIQKYLILSILFTVV